ncbi:MAG: N-6 DNA methylase [Armatimonadetes bacterium]|nr:N-6 DNA methylase [Armatimonadota bacterium]
MNIKSTHKVIKEYYSEIRKLKKLDQDNEGAVSPFFANILRFYARQFKWTLIEQYSTIGYRNSTIRPDGAIVDGYKLVHGFWEAKDTKDDFELEIKKKIENGYPTDNIIFQTPDRIIIYQNRLFVQDINISAPENLIFALKIFFEYQPPEYIEWKQAVDEFKIKIPELAQSLMQIIEREYKTNKTFRKVFIDFEELCKDSINKNLRRESINEMLIQHLLTERIFRKIFHNPDFRNNNTIAAEIEKVILALTSKYFSRTDFLKKLDRFYYAIEHTAELIKDYSQKQDFMNTVYENFFQGFSVKVANTHGIVYTPQPIVDFMVNSVQDILQIEFNKSLSDENVHILDPFVGTGNFILRVMKEVMKTSLQKKYDEELHCNEVMLLPYYISSMNIEHLYFELTGKYKPFKGICLVDTFELAEEAQHILDFMNKENTDRINKQKGSPITVIIGNPPYNANQVNENDNNKNRKYPALDKKIHDTYAKDSKATLKSKLFDPYIKAIKFASERIEENGVVAYISNNSFIKDFTFDGMRKHLFEGFNRIYIIDLQGDIRKDSMKDGIPLGEKHTVFGLSAMVGVSITFLIKNTNLKDRKIFYNTVDFRATRNEKFEMLEKVRTYHNMHWKELIPDENNNWLNEDIQEDFKTFLPMGTKETKNSDVLNVKSIFKYYSLGVSTNRDYVVYDFNKDDLEDRIIQLCDDYNNEVTRYENTKKGNDFNIDEFVNYEKIKWSSTLKNHCKRGEKIEYDEDRIESSLFRPFTKQNLYYDNILIDRPGHFREYLPNEEKERENKIIFVSGIAHKKQFQCLMVNKITSLDFLEKSQCFPFYVYKKDGSKRTENITDWSLEKFRNHYQAADITKWDIFYYIYAALHNTDYREKYSANLKRELPRIPFYENFQALSEFGKQLSEIHLNYENADEYTLEMIETPDTKLDWNVIKMRLSKDKTELKYNDFLTLNCIPEEVYQYKLGNRSALHWIIDQYRIKTDKVSGITHNPNNHDDQQYIVRLIKKIVTVSLESVRIVGEIDKFEL